MSHAHEVSSSMVDNISQGVLTSRPPRTISHQPRPKGTRYVQAPPETDPKVGQSKTVAELAALDQVR
jgi:hypothetical protein